MRGRRLLRGAALAVPLLVPALAGVTGKWTAAIDTQIGIQNYTRAGLAALVCSLVFNQQLE